jgi:hypothetical protein
MSTPFPAWPELHHACWRSQINILKDRDTLGDSGMDGKTKVDSCHLNRDRKGLKANVTAPHS